ncbi:phage baseplate protein [Eggerthella timonensis]|uniref:phage baseplate protein n=1 Tax=Eggerthella timonensis TaxID=1871008 RepID=UPI000C77DD71|nr:hypothetical protein [Eggerthella timonensis]
MDAFEIAQLMTGQSSQRPLRMRFGTVLELGSGTTLLVRPDGQQEAVPAIRCCHPAVGNRVALLVGETEWLAIAVVGGDREAEGFAPANHKHTAADITSGTLSVARGGTGVTTTKAIGLLAYPVGAVYISYVSTSPASLFGGTWTAITGRFPYFNAGTATGGSNTHTLTVAQMPSHTHTGSTNRDGAHDHWFGLDKDAAYSTASSSGYSVHSDGKHTTSGYSGTWVKTANPYDTDVPAIHAHAFTTKAAGGGAAHNNMPAYQTLYAWRRTA